MADKDEMVIGTRVSTDPISASKEALEQMRQIRRVLVNYSFPDLRSPISDLSNGINPWTRSIYYIGKICREAFPNMRPEESNFNIHMGFSHFRCDKQLLANASCDEINMEPK